MTRRSVLEYAEAVRYRYRLGNKVEKGKILDEFTRVTGWHRKAVIRLLNRRRGVKVSNRRGVGHGNMAREQPRRSKSSLGSV